MAETLRFDITGNTSGAQRANRDLAGTMDLAARGARLLSESLDKQKRAAAASAGATIAAAKADKILADASDEAIASFVAEREALDRDRKAKEENAAASAALARSSKGAALGASALASPMGALAAAGVALSPVIVTLGAGLAGLGAAAFTLSKNQQLMRQTLAPLKADFAAFSKSLQPVLLQDFNAALTAARPLLRGIEPVAKATGQALAGVLQAIGAEFRSGEFQRFFDFMARTAGPDVRLLGATFVDLTRALPPLLEQLQPVATDLLSITDAMAKLVSAAARVNQSTDQTGKHMSSLEQIGTALRLALFAPGVGLYHALKLLGIIGPDAGKGIKVTGDAAQGAAYHVGSLAQAVTALNTAESKSLNTQLAYTNALIAAGDDAKTLRQALHASSGEVGLQTATQRASFGAANTYIADLSQAAQQAIASGKGAGAAARAIAAGLPILDSAKTKNRLYWQEVRTLKQWLDRLRLEKAIQETITVSGSGHWTVVRPGTSLGLPGGTAGGPFAAGGRVPGSGNTDSYVARLTPGEVVVPKPMVSAGAVDHLRGMLPGFASGGLVGSYHGALAGLQPWARRDLAATNHLVIASLGNAISRAVVGAIRSATSGFMDTGARSGNAFVAQQYAAGLLSSFGWGRTQFGPLLALWNRESGWNSYAVNASSGAYGIPQSLGHGHPYNLGDYKAQIIWGLNYIRSRYGSPAAAWGHETSFGWYRNGLHGYVNRPTVIGVGERGRERVDITPAGRGGGALVHIENLHVREPQDIDLIARRLSFQLGQ